VNRRFAAQESASHVFSMNKKKVTAKRKTIDWDAVCEETRQRGNKWSDEQRRALLDEGLRIIYGVNATAPTRRR
jgi:hypothetical protein